ncbi:MAG: MFS transporter [Chloroflexota bacterium]|nr:MFS transporter [Chloroflexota bacterium]
MHIVPTESLKRNSSPNLILFVVCIGIFLAALDQTVIYGALADIMLDLHMPVTELDQAAWIVTGYLLGYTFAMPLVGRISDVYGHRLIYILAMLIFIVGSVFIALVDNFNLMVAARVLQAIGGGAVVPVAMAIVGDTYSVKRRAIAMGIIGAAVEGGGALGPSYGGVIAQYVNWRWIFWINIPVGLIVIALVYFLVKGSPRIQARVDYQGGLLLAVSLALLSVGFSQQLDQQHAGLYMAGFLVASVLFFALFIYRELRAPEPLFRLSMFRVLTFAMANITHLLVGGALIIAMITVPLMADTIMQKSPLEGGLRLMRLTVMIPIGAILGGFLCHRLGYRFPTILGLISSSVGFFFMSRWTLEVAEPYLTIHLAICGFGFGLVISPITTAILNSVREDERGIASALVTVMRMVGMIVGLSAISSFGMGHFHTMTAEMSLQDIINTPQELEDAVLSLFQNFFLAAAIVCLLAILPALRMRAKPGKEMGGYHISGI